jgi:hypothetical protein
MTQVGANCQMVNLPHGNIPLFIVPMETGGPQESPKLLQVRGIIPYRVDRGVSLHTEMLQKPFNQVLHSSNPECPFGLDEQTRLIHPSPKDKRPWRLSGSAATKAAVLKLT